MIQFQIELENNETGEGLKFPVNASNGSEALGKIIQGKIRFSQPHPDDERKMKIQPFIPEKGKWVITRMDNPALMYPEMLGRVLV